MSNRLLSIVLALFIAFGGLSFAVTSTASANCGKCETKPKVCEKCKKAGKKGCACNKHKCDCKNKCDCKKCDCKKKKKDCGCR